MRRTIVINVGCLLILTGSYAQYTTFRAGVGSGFFHYYNIPEKGVREPYYSMFNFVPPSSGGYANDPRGDQGSFSYQFRLVLQRTTRYHFIFGLGAGYESRTSRKEIRNAYDVATQNIYPATGDCMLHNNLVFSTPFIGYELVFGKTNIDITTGFDLMFPVSDGHEVSAATITASGQVLHNDSHAHTQIGYDAADARINYRIEILRGQWGISLGYAHGIANEDGGAGILGIGTGAGNYSRFVETGIVYQVRLNRKHKTN